MVHLEQTESAKFVLFVDSKRMEVHRSYEHGASVFTAITGSKREERRNKFRTL